MPLYYFKCNTCPAKKAYRLKPGEQKADRNCPVCGGLLAREPRPPSYQVMESIDNCTQPRRVERLADAERLYAERAANDPQLKPV